MSGPGLTMGKSPGKWIKTVLFGKKSSKSNIPKGREKLVNQKEGVITSKVSETGLAALEPTSNNIDRHEEDLELVSKEAEDVLPGNEEIDTLVPVQQDAPLDPEKIRQEEAATKTQAVFRGYLARRAFKALKGIIRLQALIRGHLVRRQAAVTLCCMYGIVKLQALVRGKIIRKSDVGFAIHEKCNLLKIQDDKTVKPIPISTKITKLSANAFIRKLIASSTTIMALRLQYVRGDPNAVLSWLERWSGSQFWKPVPQPKKTRDTKSQKKQQSNNVSIGDAQMSKSKRTHRKLPTANLDPIPAQANPEFEKPKRSIRKIPSQPSEPIVENPQIELEKVKRNLRKVHNPVVETAILSEVESETRKPHLEKEKVASSVGVSEQVVISNSNGMIKKEVAALTISSEPNIGITPKDSVSKEVFDTPSINQVIMESKPLTEITSKERNISDNEVKNDLIDLPETIYKDENSQLTNGDMNHKEDQTGSENQKPTRKASNVAKQERADNGLQDSPTVPSYMAATESAKAKLRAQGSPRFGQDGNEKKNNARRHSLPSSTNSKISSQSPRTQRAVQSGGKGGHKSDKAISSSKDGNGKVVQAEWRR